MTDVVADAVDRLAAILTTSTTSARVTDMNNLVKALMVTDLTSGAPPGGSKTVASWQAYVKAHITSNAAWAGKTVPKGYAKRFITNFADGWSDLATQPTTSGGKTVGGPKWSTMTQAMDYMQAKGGFAATQTTADPVYALAKNSAWCTNVKSLNATAQANLDLYGDFARGVDFCKTANADNPSAKPDPLTVPSDTKSICAIARGQLTNHSNDGRQVANYIRQDTCKVNYANGDIWNPPKVDSTHFGTVSSGLMAENPSIKGQYNKTGKWSRITGGNGSYADGKCDPDIISNGDCSALHAMYKNVADGASAASQAKLMLYIGVPVGVILLMLIVWGMYKLLCR